MTIARHDLRFPGPRGREAILLGLLIALLCIPVTALIYRSTLRVPINYNEGWNAYYTTFVLEGRPLYYPPAASFTNNYPPLSFLIVAPLAALMGDALFAGRVVAWLAFGVVTLCIAGILKRFNGDSVAAMFGAAVFASYMVVNYDIYVGMDDPQMAAHAFMLLGLYVYVRRGDAAWSSVAAAILMCCGLFTKHNIVSLPIAVAIWLAVYDRRACLRFVGAGALSAAVGLAACAGLFGLNFVASILASRPYDPVRAWRHVVEWTVPMEVPLIMSALTCVPGLRDRYANLFTGYVLVSLAVGAAASGGDATNFNLFFDVVIAFALAVGHLLARLQSVNGVSVSSLRLWVIAAYAFSAFVTAGFVISREALLIRPWIAAQARLKAESSGLIQQLVDHPGPALCEQLALCYWSGKRFEVDPLNFTWGVTAGTKDLGAELQRVASGYYGIIVIRSRESFLPPQLVEEIKSDYRLSVSGRVEVYVRP